MAKSAHWLKRPHVTAKFIIAAATLWVVGSLLLDASPYGLALERIARQFDFAVRDYMRKSPELHPRLKVFALDDKSVAWLRSDRMSFEDWTRFLHALDQQKPSAIYIDQMFSIRDVSLANQANLDLVKSTFKELDTPVYVAGFSVTNPIEGRQQIDLSGDQEHDIRSLMYKGGYQSISGRDVRSLRVARAQGPQFYGPDPVYRELFSGVGHIEYDGSDYVRPLIRVTPTDMVPHLGFRGLYDMTLSKGWPHYGDRRLPVDRQGRMLVNWVDPKHIWSQSYALRVHLSRAFRGDAIDIVRPGDVVVVLPAMYTGHTDFKSSPYGFVPGGFHLVSVLNSVLRDQWIAQAEGKVIFVILAAAMGAYIGANFSAGVFISSMLAIAVLILFTIQLFFANFGWSFTWLPPAISFFGAGVTCFIERTRIAEKKASAVRHALEGSISPQQLGRLTKKPYLVNLEARERVVTVMFVDVVGFSLMAENQLPRLAFAQLKQTLNAITKVVYHYGGIINKNLGDGLLCFFGYNIETDHSMPDHAEQAVICAIRIQQFCLQENLRAAAAGEPVYPLRIGVNTASVFMGDLGYGDRIDFTVVGNGVNFAKRLEGACDPYSVLISSTTYELVRNLMLERKGLCRKRIQIKHHQELIEAISYDPFFDSTELREQAESAFRKCTSIARSERRWLVANPANFRIQTSVGPAELINYSNAGMSIRLPHSIARAAAIAVTVDSVNGLLGKELSKIGMNQLLCEIRWSYQDRGGVIHGLSFSKVTEEQTSGFVEKIKTYALSTGLTTHEKAISAERTGLKDEAS